MCKSLQLLPAQGFSPSRFLSTLPRQPTSSPCPSSKARLVRKGDSMHILSRMCFALGALFLALFLSGCQGLKSSPEPPPPTQPPPQNNNQPFTVAVTPAGGGSGMVTSDPSGIDCGSSGSTCTATFQPDTKVTLTAKAGSGFQFAGWSGTCTGTGNCALPSDS